MASSPTQPFPFDVFLSHSSKDKPQVRVLAKQFRDQEGLRCWYDEWNLQPGLPWQEALEKGLAESASIIVFIGPEKLGPWHNEELREAINRSVGSNDGFRVIPALLPGADPETLPTFLKRMMWIDFRGGIDDQVAYKKITAAVRGEAFEEAAFSLPDTVKPFVGFASFTEGQKQYFFGRKKEVDALFDLVESRQGLVLSGNSGVGKSSLVQAGLLPELKQYSGTRNWQHLWLRPGSDPLRSLANAVTGIDPDVEGPMNQVEHAQQLYNWMKESDTALQDALAVLHHTMDQTLFVVINQFEELFYNCKVAFPDQHKKIVDSFAKNIAHALKLSDGRVRFLLVLRSDFLEEFDRHGVLAGTFPASARMELQEMEEEQMREFIQQSAFTAGAFFEKGLVNSLLREVAGQACKLCWLQAQLEYLWAERKGSWLTVDAFERGGGISEAVQMRADRFLKIRGMEAINGALRMALLRLIEPGEGREDRRYPATREALMAPALEKAGIEELLYELTGPEFRLAEAHAETVILCHDVLVREWEPTKVLLQLDRDAVRVLHRMAGLAGEWQARSSGKGKEFLLGGVMLEEFETLESMGEGKGLVRNQLPALEHAFIKASFRDRALKKRRTRIVMGVISAALAIALVFMVIAMQAQKEAEKNLQLAEANHNQFLEEQAEKVRTTVQEIIDRATLLGQREGDYVDQRRQLLQQAKAAVRAYEDNVKLKSTVEKLDNMLMQLSPNRNQ
jgi:hypothetical protein